MYVMNEHVGKISHYIPDATCRILKLNSDVWKTF